MRLAYATDYDSTDVDRASGLGLHIGRALARQGAEVVRIAVRPPPWLRARSAARKARHVPRGRTYLGGASPRRLDANARRLRRALDAGGFDVVLSPAVAPVAHLDGTEPVVLWLDTTMGGLIGFYPEFSRLAPESERDLVAADRAALRRCALAVFSSDWAARVALERYDLDPGRVRVVPYGANLACPYDDDELGRLVRARAEGPCRLLFLGRDWERKGGPKAVAVLAALRRAGVPSELTVVGPSPGAIGPVPPGVRVRGALGQATADGRRALAAELARSHVLLLPTTVDCCPVALAEAAAFAVPAATTDVAGIPTAIADGVNGRTFAPSAPPEAYAAWIAGAVADPARYERLAHAALAASRTRLNWQAAGAAVTRLLEALVAEPAAR